MSVELVLQISQPAEQAVTQTDNNQVEVCSYHKLGVLKLRFNQGQYKVINENEITQLLEGESFKLGNLKIKVQELKNNLVQHSAQAEPVEVNPQAPQYLNLEPEWLMTQEEQSENGKICHRVTEYNSIDFLDEPPKKFSFINENPLSVYFKSPIFIEEAPLLPITNQKKANILEQITIGEEH